MSGNKLSQHTQKQRIYLYDNVKWLAIVLVVIGHAIDFLARTNTGNQLEKSLFVIIYSFHMPLFIFISGLFLKPMDKDTKFPRDKVISFLAIGIVLRAFTSILKLFLGEKDGYSVLDMYDNYTWFMGAMAAFVLITWILRSFDKKIIIPVAILVGCMAGYDKNLGDKFALMRIAVFFPIFIIGYYLTPEKILKPASVKWLKIVAVLVIAGFVTLCLLNKDFVAQFRPLFTGRNRFTVLEKDQYAFGALFRLATYGIASLMGLSVICLLPNKKLGYITTMGGKTLQIYFWHKMFLIIFEHFKLYDAIQARTGDTAATTIYILIAVGVAFLCSIPILSFPTKQLLSMGKKTMK